MTPIPPTPAHRLVGVLALLATVPAALLTLGGCEAVEPGEQAHIAFTGPKYLSVAGQLTGRHSQIACEGCHVGQTPPFGTVSDACLDCHEADRKTPTHYPDRPTCGSDGCHAVTDYCWTGLYQRCDNDPTPTPTDTGPTDTDTDPSTDTGTTETDTETVPTGNSCAVGGCHGAGPIREDAAPASSSHNAHLSLTPDLWAPSTPVTCSTCHPDGDYAGTLATHQNKVADVTLAGIAVGDNTAATFTAGTCSGTYCHGASMADPPADPVWDGGGGEAVCGTCHASPPVNMYEGGAVATHPALDNCGLCHAPTGGPTGAALADVTGHINGTVEAN